MKSRLDRLLETAVVVAIVVWLLDWSWHTLRPLLPVVATSAAVVLVAMFLLRHLRQW